MLEKGRFTPAADLSLRERESGKEMYEMGTLLTTIDAGETSSGCQAPIWKCHLLPAYNRTWRPADAVMVFCNCSEQKHGALSVACT